MLIACLLYVTAVFSFSFFFEAKYPTASPPPGAFESTIFRNLEISEMLVGYSAIKIPASNTFPIFERFYPILANKIS